MEYFEVCWRFIKNGENNVIIIPFTLAMIPSRRIANVGIIILSTVNVYVSKNTNITIYFTFIFLKLMMIENGMIYKLMKTLTSVTKCCNSVDVNLLYFIYIF